MSGDIKNLRARIKSVDSTLHLTSAMGLVASSKIRRAGTAMQQGRQYADALGDTVQTLASSPECRRSPYMQPRDGAPETVIVIAGDRGLAGGYNANAFRACDALLSEISERGGESRVIPIGKRACDRYGAAAAESFASSERIKYAEVRELAERLCSSFTAGECSRVHIVSTVFVSMMKQEAGTDTLLPLSPDGAERRCGCVLYEPDGAAVLDTLVSEYVAGRIYAAVKESFASEVAARRMAMDSAEKNAKQMIFDLQLSYNRARQSAITQEITEIVAGSGD